MVNVYVCRVVLVCLNKRDAFRGTHASSRQNRVHHAPLEMSLQTSRGTPLIYSEPASV